ncbi:response regulator [Chloroflexia bacterium SDU3-3]|nr:response regulator [Chloroflexia bacterium SDU3-3]
MGTDSGRALVIDDERSIRELCVMVLAQLGYYVEQADDGDVALELIGTADPFDLVLVDVHLPRVGGIEVLRELRRSSPSTMVVVMTGYGSSAHSDEATRLGARAVLLKPFSIELLRSLAREVVPGAMGAPPQTPMLAHPLGMVSERLMGQADLSRLYQQIVDVTHEVLALEQVLLVLVEGGVPSLAASLLPPDESARWLDRAEWVIAHGRVLSVVPDMPRPDGIADLAFDPQHTYVAVPMLFEQRVAGALLIERRTSGGWGAAQHDMLLAIASIAAVAISQMRSRGALAGLLASYRAVLAQSQDCALLLDGKSQRIVEANAATVALSGYSQDALQKLAPQALIAADYVYGLETRVNAPEFEATLHARGGHKIAVSVAVSAIAYADRPYLLVIARDIRERNRQTQQAIRAEKLSGMGRLSASIAHEVNNPLQALQSSINLLLENRLSADRHRQIIQMANAQVAQLVGVVQQMMDLYRPAMREGMRPISLHELLESVLSAYAPQLQAQGVAVERLWDAYLPRVRGVASQLRQVLGSLIQNASEAMPSGGRLVLQTAAVDSPSGRMVRVVISDTGGGIDPESMGSLFEPFYSTKVDRTGLSLAVSYSIIEQHSGTITVEATEGGTAFVVLLPAIG